MLAEETVRKTPEETLRDVKPLLDEAGVTRIANITGMDRIGIPVYAAIRPDSKCLAVDSGKGVTKIQAKCSAAMEAIERWAHDEYLIECIQSEGASVHKFPLISGAVFNSSYKHKWCEARYWNNEARTLVPYYHVMNYEKRLPLYETCWQSGTNGLAIHNTRDEAILHGLYEIIERDAITIWMARGCKYAKRIENSNIIDSTSRDLVAMCEGVGVEPYIYNATSDIGIPVYICIMVDRKADIGMYKGYGCNLDCDIALQRSICEAAQGRAVFLSGGRDDMRWSTYMNEINNNDNQKKIAELDSESRTNMPHKNHTGLDLSDSDKISLIEERLTGCGCGHIIVATLMEREQATVVKVMSERLEGYWNRYLQLGKRATIPK